MNTIFKTLIVLACVTSQMAFAADVPNVYDLLDRYAENQDKLSSFIAKTEETISTKRSENDPLELRRMVTEARVDGKRTHIFYHLWRNLPTKNAPTPMSEAANWIDLWDGNIATQWYYRESEGGSGSGQILRDEKVGKANINGWYSGAPFMGVRYSAFERIDSVLRQAHTISVRNELEQVGSSACYVIDANTASGTYAVWLDPQHGYQVAQAEIRVGPNDRWLVTTLGENESRSLSIRNVRFEDIDGIWITMEADMHATSVQPRIGKNLTRDEHHKITQMTLNPDHEALGSFVPVVADGAKMWDMDFEIKYIWQDGELVPDVDEDALDLIRETAQEIKDQNLVPPGLITTDRAEAAPNNLTTDTNGPPEAQKDSNEGERDIQAQSRSLPLAVLIVISLSIIASVGFIVLCRPRTSEK